MSVEVQPLIAVDDIPTSRRWYESLLDCSAGHGGTEYEQILCDGRLVLQLHRWDAHDHPHLGSREAGPVGNGALLWFHTEAFDHAVVRVKHMQADVLQGPMANPNAGHREIWLRDPDGYVVVVAGI